MISLKDKMELNNLTTNELILLYFVTISEANNPHIKAEGGSPYNSYEIKQRYIKQYQNQAVEIKELLKRYKVKTNHFYLKYKYLKLKYFISK